MIQRNNSSLRLAKGKDTKCHAGGDALSVKQPSLDAETIRNKIRDFPCFCFPRSVRLSASSACLSVCLSVGCAALEIALAKRRRCGGGFRRFRSLPSQPTDRPTDRQGEGINQSRYELPLHSKPSLSFFRWFGFGWEEGGEGGIDLVTALVKKNVAFFVFGAKSRPHPYNLARESWPLQIQRKLGQLCTAAAFIYGPCLRRLVGCLGPPSKYDMPRRLHPRSLLDLCFCHLRSN